MKRKQFCLRFNLDNKEDLIAWDHLHQGDSKSINREIISLINRAQELSDLEALIRRLLSEELGKRQLNPTVDYTQTSSDSENEENLKIIFDFLDSFY